MRGIAAQPLHGLPHRGQVDDGGNTGEILQEDAAGGEGDLLVRYGQGLPAGQRLDVLGAHEPAVLASQEVLEEDFERIRQASDAWEAVRQGVDAEDGPIATIDAEAGSAPKRIQAASGSLMEGSTHGMRPPFAPGTGVAVPITSISLASRERRVPSIAICCAICLA